MTNPTDFEPFRLPQAPMTSAFANNYFRFVPCGIFPEMLGVTVYVKFKSSKELSYDSPIRVIDNTDRWVHFDCPDRELLFCRDGNSFGGDRPFNNKKVKWDKAISLHLTSETADDFAFDRFMINSHPFGEKMPNMRKRNALSPSRKVVMQDSGGYQIAYGALDFIDPVALAKNYRNNADEGVVLDLPARQLGEQLDIIVETAKIHRLNARLMTKNLPKGFRLGDVVHGLRMPVIDAYRKGTDDSKIDYKFCCISFSKRMNLIEAMHRALYIIMNGRQYTHYHMLAVGNPTLLAAIARLTYVLKHSGRHVLITTDASTPVRCTHSRAVFVHASYYSGLARMHFGMNTPSGVQVAAGGVPNVHRKFATSDQVSAALGGYIDLIHTYNKPIAQIPLIYSNQIQVANYVSLMGEYADKLTLAEYKQLVLIQFNNTKHRMILGVAMDYLDYAVQYGLEKAMHRYAYYMPMFTGATGIRAFPSLMTDDEEEDKDETSRTSMTRFRRVLSNFDHYHKTGQAPAVQKPTAKNRVSAKNFGLQA